METPSRQPNHCTKSFHVQLLLMHSLDSSKTAPTVRLFLTGSGPHSGKHCRGGTTPNFSKYSCKPQKSSKKPILLNLRPQNLKIDLQQAQLNSICKKKRKKNFYSSISSCFINFGCRRMNMMNDGSPDRPSKVQQLAAFGGNIRRAASTLGCFKNGILGCATARSQSVY